MADKIGQVRTGKSLDLIRKDHDGKWTVKSEILQMN